MTEVSTTGRRRGRERTAGHRDRLPEQRPFRQPRMRFTPTEVVSADELESIHDASLRILAEIGMNFLDAGARERLAAAGATRRRRTGALRPGDGRRADPHVPVGVPAALVEPGAHADDRRRPHRLRVGRQPAELRRPRRRPPSRDTRGVPRPAQAVPRIRDRPLPRRLPGRTDRRALVGAPPGGGARPADLHRQGAAHLQPRRPAQPRRAGDDPDRPPGRRRHAGTGAVGVHRRQLLVTAAPRRADAAGHDRAVARATRSS